MAAYRAKKSGFAAEAQQKIEKSYDQEEARKCLQWIQMITGTDEIPSDPDSIDASPESFYSLLHNGRILCKLIDTLMPGCINWTIKTFAADPKIEAMRIMCERERIALFTKNVLKYGVQDTYSFPTESLHDKGALNLNQVCVCIRALGIEAQTKPDYPGIDGFWPKKAQRNTREFTEDQLKAGQNVIGLQMGSNKGATQAGMNIGKGRHIID